MVVTIKLTFDENLHIQTVEDPRSVDSEVANPRDAATAAQIEPLVIRRGDTTASFIQSRIPRKGAIELPGFRQAGQFTLDFDWRDLPIDPRLVRAAAVEIYMGAVDGEDFSRGMTQVEPNGSRRSIISTVNDAGQRNDEALVMIGMVDEWDVEHGDTGSIVSMKGRDMRGVLLDTPVAVVPNADRTLLDELDLTQPIDVVVSQILRFNPLFDEMAVTVNPAEWPDGVVPAPDDPGLVPRHRRGATGERTPRASTNQGLGDTNFWDLITRFCFFVGAIPYFEGTWLRIRPSATIFDQVRAGIDPNVPTPFARGEQRTVDAQSGATLDPALSVRRLVYGRDTRSVQFNRRFGGFHRPRIVRCVAHNSSSTTRGESPIMGRWPREDASATARTTRRGATGAQSQEEVLTIPVRDVTDPARLEAMARAVYEEVGRGEMGGSCETVNLASFGGDNADPDMLRMRPGDGIEFFVDTRNVRSGAPLISALTNMDRASFEEAVTAVMARIGDENLARVIVATGRGLIQEVQRFFRVSTVRFTWDAKSGVAVNFDFQNYVVARNQIVAAPSDPGTMGTRVVPSSGGGRILVLDEIAISGSTTGTETG